MDFTNPNKYIKDCFRFKGFVFDGLHDMPEGIDVYLKRTRRTGNCPECKRVRCKIELLYTRKIRDLDLRRKCTLVFPQAKIQCYCGYRGVERLNFVDKHSLCTTRFEEYVFLLCEKMTIKDAAALVKLDWKTVKDIDKKFLKKRLVPLSESSPKNLGVDEIATSKGHNYTTVVRDVDAKRVLWVGDGRKKETLDKFFLELGKPKSYAIKTFTMDMWDPYIASVEENCPNADIIFDKFHISKKVNEGLDTIRKKEFSKADEEERKDMKHKRFLILSRQRRLNDEQRETVEDLKAINAPLYEAYLLKEQVLDIFDETNVHAALTRLGKWIANVERLGIEPFLRVISTMRNYWYGIANYFRYRFTNAASEGFNNKINVIKRRAYGFRDMEYFKLKILHTCGWRSS
jgi:transposase